MRPLLALLVLSTAGCAGGSRAVSPHGLADLNADLAGRQVTVVLADGSRQRVEAPRIEADSTSWFDLASREMRTVATSSVVEIRHARPERVTRRVGLGIGVGFSLGGAASLAHAPDDGVAALGNAMLGGLAGTFFGLAYGILGDSETRVQLWPLVEARGETSAPGEPASSPGVASGLAID